MEKESRKSLAVFNSTIAPALLRSNLEITRVVNVEKTNRTLDQNAGIDCLLCMSGVVVAADCKVQFDRDWKTFVVRTKRNSGADTTLEKLTRAQLVPGALMPYFSVQCYYNRGKASVYMARTQDILDAIRNRNCSRRFCDNAEFAAVYVDDLLNEGKQVWKLAG